MKTILRNLGLLAAIAGTLAGGRTATAQVPFFPVVPYGPGVYRTAIPTEVFLPPRAFIARVDASFTLTPVAEEEEGESVTHARYYAANAVIVLTPVNAPQDGLRLVGRVEVSTNTTEGEDGIGDITGTLRFTGRTANGVVANLMTLNLSGEYRANADPLRAEGALQIPAANPYEKDINATIAASLSSNANLVSRLNGLAQVVIW